MEITNSTLCVVDISQPSIYDFIEEWENPQEKLTAANQSRDKSIKTWAQHIDNYPDRTDFVAYLKQEKERSFDVMTYGDFLSLERDKLLSGPLTEITKDRFQEMLNVLPPLNWVTYEDVEMFCMCEMFTGTYTDQYAHDKATGKFYVKMVDASDCSTWIHNILR